MVLDLMVTAQYTLDQAKSTAVKTVAIALIRLICHTVGIHPDIIAHSRRYLDSQRCI